MTLGKTIRRLRIEHCMTQDELAEKLGYKSRSTITNIETGRQDVPRKTILKLAQIFDVPVNELIDVDLTIADVGDLSEEESNKKESGPHLGGSADR